MSKIFCLTLIWSFLYSHTADHLIFIKVVTLPTEGEMVAIHNPTSNDIDLSDYYITDATDIGKVYYNLPSNENYWSESSRDFIARFPADYIISSGDTITLGLHDMQTYHEHFNDLPAVVAFLHRIIETPILKPNAHIVVQHATSIHLPDIAFNMAKQKKYGDTTVSIFSV